MKVAKDPRDGLYDVKVIAKYPKNALKSETIINCQLRTLGTDYTKTRETVYYGAYECKNENLRQFLFSLSFFYLLNLAEQEPTLSDHDSMVDEEGDLVLSWESLEAVPLSKGLLLFCLRNGCIVT